MRCPHCSTENREDRATCYHCGRDLSMLRLIVSRARQHYNAAVDQAEQGHYYEALGELNSGLELDSRMEQAHVLRGSLLARLERFDEARDAWARALALNPQAMKASKYIGELGQAEEAIPLLRRSKGLVYMGVGALGLALFVLFGSVAISMSRGGEEKVALSEARARELALQREKLVLLREGGFYPEAIDLMESLTNGPDAADLKTALAEESDLLRSGLVDRLRAVYSDVPLSESESIEARSIRKILAASFPESSDDVAAITSQADETVASQLRDQLRDLAGAEVDIAQSMEILRDAEALVRRIENDELRSQLMRTIETAAGDVSLVWLDQARSDESLLQQLELAKIQLEALPLTQERRSLIMSELSHLKAGVSLARLTLAIDDNRLAEAQAIAAELDNVDGRTMEQSERLATERERLATRSYYELMAMGDAIEGRKLTDEQAARAVLLVDAVRGGIPARFGARTEENATFFALRAHQLLGNREMASVEEKRLETEFPGSPYLAILRE